MAEIYVNLADVLKKKQFSYDLKQYAVTEKDVRSARKIEIVPDEDVGDMESAIKALANRCAILSRGMMCEWCSDPAKSLCEKHRTVFRRADNG